MASPVPTIVPENGENCLSVMVLLTALGVLVNPGPEGRGRGSFTEKFFILFYFYFLV